MRTTVTLKNGFRYQGEMISENDRVIEIDDIKLGLIEITKDDISVRTKQVRRNE